MAIAIPRAQSRLAQRPAWVHRRGAEPDAVLAAFMLILLFCGIAALAVIFDGTPAPAPLSERLWPERAANDLPRDGAAPAPEVVVEAQAAPVAAPATAPEPVPAPAPMSDESAMPNDPTPEAGLVVGETARVVNTDGLGVVLHAAPSKDARMPAGLLEGARVTVLELGGGEWVRVKKESGNRTGWVPAAFLAPAT